MSVSYLPLQNNVRVNNTDSAPTKIETSATPLLPVSAPIAKSEKDDDMDDRETVTTAYPGVDDGFFLGKDKDNHPDVETINPEKPGHDVEIIPSHPKDPEPVEPQDKTPDVTPRNNGSTDDIDGKHDDENGTLSPPTQKPNFPYAPGYGFAYGHSHGHDLEVGSIPGEIDSIPDVNVYQHKKTLAQGMMDLALFSANANQLRYVLESYNRHPYYFPSLSLISISLILQVAVGVGLIWNASYNVKDEKEICIANKISNFTIIGIFLVTIVNVFISAFGVANPP